MAQKLTTQQIKSIIARQKPGFEVETDEVTQQETAAMSDHSHAQTDAPDLRYLAAKFLSATQNAVTPPTQTTTNASKIVRVHPAGAQSIDAAGTGNRKVVVVSARDEKVVGEQG